MCCNFRFRGLCPGASSRTRRRAHRLFSGPAFWLPYVSGCFSSADALLVPGPDFRCRVGQHLAAVRLRLDHIFIKQSNADRRERCVSWTKGALTRGRSGWWGLGSGLLRGRASPSRGRCRSEVQASALPASPDGARRFTASRLRRGGLSCPVYLRLQPCAAAVSSAERYDHFYSPGSSGSRYWSGSRSRASAAPSCSRTSLISRKTRPAG